MSDKIFKNPNRSADNYRPQTPQYKVRGIEPAIDGVKDNPRLRKPGFRQELDNEINSNPVPNIGNNDMWAGMDSDNFGNGSIDPNHEMVDNNDFVDTGNSTDNLLEITSQMKEDEYLLIVKGSPILSGTHDYIQEQATLLIFAEHPIYDGTHISVNDIMIIKKVKIKLGLFLE